MALDTSPSSCTLRAWNARGPSSQPGPAVRPPPPSQAASPQQFAVDTRRVLAAPPPREDFLHLPERGDTPRGTLVLAPASAGDGEAPEKRRSSGGRWARGAAPWSRGVGPATSWVTAWPVRPVPRGPDTSQLSRGPLASAGARCPLGRQRFSSGPHRPQPGCPSGAALRLRGRDLVAGPWSHAVLHGPRPGPTQRLLHHSGVLGCWTLGATAERWRGHPTPHTEPEPCRPPGRGTAERWRATPLRTRSRSPAAPGSPSSPSEVTFSGLALGVGRGGLDSGLWCGDLFPSALPEA